MTLNEVKAKAENETLSESEKAKALRAAKTLKAVRAVQADKALRVSQVAKQELADLAKKGTVSMEDTGEQTKIMQCPDTSGTGSEKQS
ncbi:hypothetical protein OZX74_00900 [Bifidobacterium sp. ESL0798]|uniref:hypothetical protein n=1 Tax=Bifidobacterium sp. ESL0798 TaxID=2983235 RepID=UPI0023F65DE6|nr:hypothetical protein [Bifidobacterium sp. ESL0798]WEV74157.1 hypothetical protein OZX74_00900 [Bifidobacterium sp. ESL0798]